MMNEAWKQWEGSVVDGRFVLGAFQGSSDHSAVFLTSYGPQAQNAAIKLVEANPASTQLQLSRWERASKLSHPHLIRLWQWGRCQLGNLPMLYVVTEFAEENLSQILPNRALTASETEYMLRSALEVLAYLHNAGLAHSRLKPANLMAVGDDLRLSSDTICAAGEKSVSPREPTVYDAPEMATSGPSPAGDIWSLGITLVEAMTQRPSPGEAIRQGDPAVPETLPPPFLEIARQCVRLDPQRRWTVPDIAARLLPASAPLQKPQARSRYILVSLVLLALFAFVAGPKLLHRTPAGTPAQPQLQVQEHKPPVSNPHTPIAADHAMEGRTNRSEGRTSKTAEAPVKSAPSPAPVPVPSRPTPRKSGASAAPGAVAETVLPAVSQRSRNTITGKVRVGVRVAVDASGHVVDASLASAGPSQYFANVALQAARRWTFTPPQVGEQAVASEWIVQFAFGRGGVEAHPQQVSP
jgi:TonB family protein